MYLPKISTIKPFIIILSCFGSILVSISAWNYGLGLSPDSVEYLATADNLLRGKGFLSFNGLLIIEWPPLYPILLFILSFIFKINTALSAVLLNALLIGLIIYKVGIILIKNLDSILLIIFGLLFILFSIPVFSESLWVHSELLFIYFVTLYLDFLISYLEKRNWLSLMILVVITALALLTRYIGLTLILTTIVAILSYCNESYKKKIVSIVTYSLLSIIPLIIWLVRNYIISGTFFGERGASRYSFWFNINITMEKILSWDIPDHFISLKMFFIIFMFMTIVFMWLFLTKKISYSKLLLTTNKIFLVILSQFVSVYISFLILISTFKAHNSIDNRLLSPIFIPFAILLVIILQAAYNWIYSIKHSKLFRIAFIILLLISFAEPIRHTIKVFDFHYNCGEGYSGSSWQKNIKEKWLKFLKESYIKNSAVYSNEPFELYYLTNNYTKWSPRKTYYDSDEIYVRLKDLKSKWPPEKKAYLVWFNKIEFHSTSLYTPQELVSISEMKIIDSSDVGTFYSIETKNQ